MSLSSTEIALVDPDLSALGVVDFSPSVQEAVPDGVLFSTDMEKVTISAGGSLLTLEKNGGLHYLHQGRYAWTNQGRLLQLHYYDRQHPRSQVVSLPSGDAHSFGTEGTPSLSCKSQFSFRASGPTAIAVRADFENIHIQIGFEIVLDPEGNGFRVLIAHDGVCEELPTLYRVLGVEIFPEFGAARTGESGYLTLPNWSGCQTFFNKSYPREVRQTIYSSNDQWEYVCNMPVFGITRSQGTLCGIIARGDFDAQLVCRVHWEREKTNSVHPQLVYRWEQEDDLLSGLREVRYSFSAPDADDGEGYVFCGKTVRHFLRQERGLLSWEEKAQKRPIVLDYRDRFFLKIFMAYKTPQADGHGPYHNTCTFMEVREILEKCLARGMTRLAVMLTGWGQDGHDGMPPTRFPVDERLGGEAAFRELIRWCKESDIMLGVHDSYGGAYECSPEFDLDDVIRHRTGEPWATVIWSGGRAHNLCPSVYVDKQTRRDIPAVRALGIYGHHHIDAVGSFMTCHSPLHPLKQREAFVHEVRKMFAIATTEIGSVSTEYPFGPYFDQMDGFYHSYTMPSPWHQASSMGRYFLDRSIPLLSVVLHGSVNCCESISTFRDQPLSRWLEWGLCPQWEVAARAANNFGIPSYDQVAEKITEVYHFYYGEERLAARLNGLWIEGRWDVAPGVSHTRYSDGTMVRVNSGSVVHGDLLPNSYRIEPACH